MAGLITRPRRAISILGIVGLLTGPAITYGQEQPDTPADSSQPPSQHPFLEDVGLYYTSPLRWDVKDWGYFAGSLGLIAIAHHYDTQVRTHFISQGTRPLGGSSQDLRDIAPTAAAVALTWAYANWIDSSDGHREAGAMVEAAAFTVVDTYALKFVVGRQTPSQTSDPNKWRHGGSSFPSLHTAAAFAVGTVLAESGNDDNRWMRRFLGYGVVAGFTAFERLKHNAHWLSDDVAGAEIGGATAHFVLERESQRREARQNYSVSLVPLQGGAMIAYSLDIR
jgi:membrane-associated phospholipid phosphatase